MTQFYSKNEGQAEMPNLNFRDYCLVLVKLQDEQVIDENGTPCTSTLKNQLWFWRLSLLKLVSYFYLIVTLYCWKGCLWHYQV